MNPMMNTVNQAKPTASMASGLRRANYIHISDLMNAYNIDHSRLEDEFQRANEHQTESAKNLGVPTELDTSARQKRLQPPREGFNACVLVGDVNVVVDKHRVDGTRVRLAEVLVGDETGTVSLRARDDQIDTLLQAQQVVLRNCTLELYQGKHIRLTCTKWGKITPFPDDIASTPAPPSNMNRARNFSKIDILHVATEIQENTPPEDTTSGASQHYRRGSGRSGGGPSQGGRGAPRRFPHPGGRGVRGMIPPGAIPMPYGTAPAGPYAPYGGYPSGYAQMPLYAHPHMYPPAGAAPYPASQYPPLARQASDDRDAHGAASPQPVTNQPPSPGMNPRAPTFDPGNP